LLTVLLLGIDTPVARHHNLSRQQAPSRPGARKPSARIGHQGPLGSNDDIYKFISYLTQTYL
jgi:hypothetical protein